MSFLSVDDDFQRATTILSMKLSVLRDSYRLDILLEQGQCLFRLAISDEPRYLKKYLNQ